MTLTKLNITTGEIPFSYPTLPRPGTTWYRLVRPETLPPPSSSSSSSSVPPPPPPPPLVVLHGGPGATHDYLVPTFDLLAARTGRAVVYYDQIGNGKSTHYRDTRLSGSAVWSVGLFIAELQNVLTHLGIVEDENGKGGLFDLYGQSWGAMLAASYAVWCADHHHHHHHHHSDSKDAAALTPRKMILGSGPASMKLWGMCSRTLIAKLPPDISKTLLDCEKRGDYASAEWKAAVDVYYKTYLCRTDPWPAELTESMRWLDEDDTVYMTMNGPSEFTVVGTLGDWDIADDVRRVTVPTLVINGEHDEAGDMCVEPFFNNMQKVRWVTMSGCSHSAHLEQPGRYAELVDQFLRG